MIHTYFADHSNKLVRASLIKLSAVFSFLFILILVCIFTNSQLARGVSVAIIFVLLPINILCCVDASRLVASQKDVSKRMKTLGAILGVPQAVIGLLLVIIGLAYPFIGIGNVYRDIFNHIPAAQDMVWIIISLIMLTIGYFYLKESLWLVLGRRRLKK